MSIRFRKSFKVAPGVKVNVGKKSVGMSVGGKHFRQSVSTSGRKTTTASLPGTGLSFVDTSYSKKKKRTSKESVLRSQNVPEPELLEPEEIEMLDDIVGDNDTPSTLPKKPRLWPWIMMGLVLVCMLAALLKNGMPDTDTASDASNISSTSITTTAEFTYSPDQVVLHDSNGSLVAFVGDRRVPYSGLAAHGIDTYVVKDGVVDTSFNGVYDDQGVLRLVRNGKVDTDSTGVVGAGNGDWYAVEKGVVATSMTGIRSNDYGSWYIQDGKVQLDRSGVVATDDGEYVITDGKVDTSNSGVYGVSGDWVYADDGKVHTDYTGVKKNGYGKWYVKDGHVDFNYSGVVSSDGSTYIIKGGKVDTSQNGVMKVGDNWAYVRDGMINTNYTGVQSNEYGAWYIRKGYVDFDYQGTVTANGGERYNVSSGKATKVTTTRAATDNGYGSGETRTQNNNVGTGIVASRNAKVYHHSWCSHANQIKASNLIHFSSEAEAQASGRRACHDCF